MGTGQRSRHCEGRYETEVCVSFLKDDENLTEESERASKEHFQVSSNKSGAE